MKTRKQKTNEQTEHQSPTKKAKQEKENDNGTQTNGTTTASSKEYQEFCKVIRENLSPDQIKEILQFNGQDPSGPDDSVISRWYVTSLDHIYIELNNG